MIREGAREVRLKKDKGSSIKVEGTVLGDTRIQGVDFFVHGIFTDGVSTAGPKLF